MKIERFDGRCRYGLWVMVLPVLIPLLAAAGFEVGDPAPPLTIAKWVRGEAMSTLGQAGQDIHVVAFWATWSKPAVESLVELSREQEALTHSGVVIIAVSAEGPQQVEDFLRTESRLADVKLRVAADQEGRTTAAYMRAAGRSAVPHAFVVGRDGRLAWQGHPGEVRAVLDQLLAGTLKAEPKQAPAPVVDSGESDEDLLDRLGQAMVRQNWRAALEVTNELLSRIPEGGQADELRTVKFGLLYDRLGNFPAARTYAEEVLKRYADRPMLLNNLAWRLLAVGDFERLDHRWPELAHELADKAYAASGGQEPGILDTYARSVYLLGYVDRAVELQKQAVGKFRDLADPEDAADQANLRALESALQYYEDVGRARETHKP